MRRRPWRGGALATPYLVGLVLLLVVPALFTTGLALSDYYGFLWAMTAAMHSSAVMEGINCGAGAATTA